jgi:hypothetical protein
VPDHIGGATSLGCSRTLQPMDAANNSPGVPSRLAGRPLLFAACLVAQHACGSEPETKTPAPQEALASSRPATTAAAALAPSAPAAAAPYDGPPDRGPCESAHDCTLRDECGCGCVGVVVSAPKRIARDESCPNRNVCDGYSAVCVLSTKRCDAIPPAPKGSSR